MSWLDETRGVHFELVRHFLSQTFDSEMFSSRGQWRTVANAMTARAFKPFEICMLIVLLLNGPL